MRYEPSTPMNAGPTSKAAGTPYLTVKCSSAYAYIADGHNGLRVIQLISPDDDPKFGGFSPRPNPRLIATYHTHGPALALSKGLDRDRAVDESGHQIAVFGRIGSRPFNLEEQQKLYLRDGQIYRVNDEVP